MQVQFSVSLTQLFLYKMTVKPMHKHNYTLCQCAYVNVFPKAWNAIGYRLWFRQADQHTHRIRNKVITVKEPHWGAGIDSASNRNEYQGSSLGVKVAGA
jgi:predicted oxidoreductase